MDKGKYIYCIIEEDQARNFGSIGIGGEGNGVSNVSFQDLSAVISDVPMIRYDVSRENMIAHTKVIEEVMKDYAVLPMRFWTVATSTDEIRSLIRKRYNELKNSLRSIDNKIELGVKAFWKDMDIIFAEIAKENKKIRQIKGKVASRGSRKIHYDAVEVGRMVQADLESKKVKESEEIIAPLKRISVDYKINKTYSDAMLLNSAFLVDKAHENEFDSQVEELVQKYSQRIKFNYVGPVPPYNFVNLVIKWGDAD